MASTRIGIVIFANSFRAGGSERQAVELAKHIDCEHFDPVTVCFQRDGPLSAELPGGLDGVETFPLASFYGPTTVRESARFGRFLRTRKPKIVVCFDFYANIFAIPLARLAGVPLVIGARREQGITKTRTQRKVELAALRIATGVVTNAQALRDELIVRHCISAERIWTVHNGLDIQRFDAQHKMAQARGKRTETTLRIGMVANLRPEKGHLMFVDACHNLSQSLPDVSFVIVGDGPMRGQIQDRIDVLGLRERVRMLGLTTDVAGALESIDIAVSTSITEGFPNSIMEAMAARLPVVATDAGGTRELVVDGVTGYLVKPGNALEMARQIECVVKNPTMRRTMGAAGRERIVRDFSSPTMARRFENLFQRLLKHKGPIDSSS